MSNVLFYIACIGFSIGIFARTLFSFGMPEITTVLVVAFAVALLWRRKSEAFSAPVLLTLSVFILVFALGSLRMDVALLEQGSLLLRGSVGTKVMLEGIVVREPDKRERVQQLTVEVDEARILVSADKFVNIQYGDSVSVSGELALPKAFETDLGRTFDYKGYLEARGVSYVMSFAQVEVTKSGQGNKFISTLFSFKHAFMEQLERAIPQPYVGLGEGLLLGAKQGLGETLEEAFRTAGIMHIVVLSGYNMMIVISFVTYFLAFFFPQRVQIFFGVLAICAFTLMVGLGASVVRASAMALLVLLAKATGRTYAVIRALCITGVVMLLLNPYLLVYDVGFQLSFIATLGLILVAPLLEPYATFMPTKFGLREFLVTTVAVQIFVTPILLYQIGEFSVVAVIVNLLVLPLVAPAMLLTFLTGLTGFISSTLATVVGYFAYLALAYIISVAEFASGIPFAAIAIPQFPFFMVVIAYAVLGYVLLKMAQRHTPEEDASKTEIETTSEVLEECEVPITEWTIIEEKELRVAARGQRHTSLHAVPKKDTPVFFR